MSQLFPGVAICPRCLTEEPMALFSSIDADTIQVQVDAILDGSFEQRACGGCGATYQPEHPMLFASHARRVWIVMQPPSDRQAFAALEVGVANKIRDEIENAAPYAYERLRGLRPRLVFGQAMLAEAVRTAWAGVDASLLECAKLLEIRRSFARLFHHGPFELVFERFDRDVAICGVRTVPDGARVDEVTLPPDALRQARADQQEMRARFPDLFDRPYVSATRYLLGTTV